MQEKPEFKLILLLWYIIIILLISCSKGETTLLDSANNGKIKFTKTKKNIISTTTSIKSSSLTESFSTTITYKYIREKFKLPRINRDFNGDGYSDIIIGAHKSNDLRGKAYIYLGGETIKSKPSITIKGEYKGDCFGSFVSYAGDINSDGIGDFLVSSTYQQSDVNFSGRVYVYNGSKDISSKKKYDAKFKGQEVKNLYGSCLSYLGNVNQEKYKYDDVIVGVFPSDSKVINDNGSAFVYTGGIFMLSFPDNTFKGENPEDKFGNCVSHAGDMNGDKLNDIIVGSPYSAVISSDSNIQRFYTPSYVLNEYAKLKSKKIIEDWEMPKKTYTNDKIGKAYIYTGGKLGAPELVLTGQEFSNDFGYFVSSAGDVNNDGYDDVLVSALYSTGNNLPVGKVYLYTGGMKMDNKVDLVFYGKHPGDMFGSATACIGDLNDDGFDDIIIGAEGSNEGQGAAYIYFGGTEMDNTSDIKIYGDGRYNAFASSITNTGDINKDNIEDFLIGAYGYDNCRGAAYIYLGGKTFFTRPYKILYGEKEGDYFAYKFK